MRTAVISRLPAAAPLSGLRWPTLVAGGLALATVLAMQGHSALLVGLATVLLATGAAVIDRRLLIPLLIVAMPFEILREVSALRMGGAPVVERFTDSTLLNVRLAIIGLAGYWVLTARSGWERLLPSSRLVLPAFALLALYVLGAIHTYDLGAQHLPQHESALVPLGSARQEAALTTAALVLHLGLFLLVPMLVRDWMTLRLCLWTFVGVGAALALVGIYQQATDVFLWNPALGLSDTPRINATFRDPNIYARLLVMAMALGATVPFAARPRWRLPLIAACVAPAALALIFTNSRSGFLTAAAVLPLTVALMPLTPRARAAALVGSLLSIAALLAVAVVVFDAALLDRIATLGEGARVLGARQVLIEGGLRMFTDNPLFGVGLAGFQDAFQGPYREYYAELQFRVSLSHTEFVTVLAELGITGAIVVAFLLARVATTLFDLIRATSGGERALIVGLGGAALVIVISAQAEGRLLNEPYLWLILGLIVAAEGIVERRRDAEPRQPAG